jgi:ABC-type branched-subunit amino acid transport system permease subunit
VLFLVLILKPSLQRRKEFTDPLVAVDPPPLALAGVERSTGLRATWAFEVLLCGGAIVWFAYIGNAYWLSLATQAVIFSIIFLSITVFTGMAGEISLAQGAFAAIGAFTVGQLASRWGLSVFVGIAAGIAIAAVVGALLAIPAMRLGGIYLALATLAFALFFESVIVKFDWASGGLLPVDVPRPIVGPINFTSDRPFFYLCIVLLGAASPKNRSAFVRSSRDTGIAPARCREARSGILGGHQSGAGASPRSQCAPVWRRSARAAAMREGSANYNADFTVQFALFWLVLVVTISPRTVDGAIAAAFALTFFPEVLKAIGVSQSWQYILFGLGAVAYARHPEGTFEHFKLTTQSFLQQRIDAFQQRRAHEPAAEATPDPSTATTAPVARASANVAEGGA